MLQASYSAASFGAESSRSPTLLVLVGLPARGKSTVANKLQAFLRWRGYQCQNFNVGAARRKDVPTTVGESSSFFSSDNESAKALRESLAMNTLRSALHWLAYEGGDVAILDATNSTVKRRRGILKEVAAWMELQNRPSGPPEPAAGQEPGRGPCPGVGTAGQVQQADSALSTTAQGQSQQPSSAITVATPPQARTGCQGGGRQPAVRTPAVIFIENICNDARVLASNMLQKVLNSPDYANLPLETALKDLQSRIHEYEKAYETVDEAKEDPLSPLGPISYIKLIDLSSKVVCRNIPGGALAYSIVNYLMVLHVGARPIWLARAGQVTSESMRAMMAARSHARMRSGPAGASGDGPGHADHGHGTTNGHSGSHVASVSATSHTSGQAQAAGQATAGLGPGGVTTTGSQPTQPAPQPPSSTGTNGLSSSASTASFGLGLGHAADHAAGGDHGHRHNHSPGNGGGDHGHSQGHGGDNGRSAHHGSLNSHGSSDGAEDSPASGNHNAVPLNIAMMSNALDLNENGLRFANLIRDFVIRRTAGGRHRRKGHVHGHGHVHDGQHGDHGDGQEHGQAHARTHSHGRLGDVHVPRPDHAHASADHAQGTAASGPGAAVPPSTTAGLAISAASPPSGNTSTLRPVLSGTATPSVDNGYPSSGAPDGGAQRTDATSGQSSGSNTAAAGQGDGSMQPTGATATTETAGAAVPSLPPLPRMSHPLSLAQAQGQAAGHTASQAHTSRKGTPGAALSTGRHVVHLSAESTMVPQRLSRSDLSVHGQATLPQGTQAQPPAGRGQSQGTARGHGQWQDVSGALRQGAGRDHGIGAGTGKGAGSGHAPLVRAFTGTRSAGVLQQRDHEPLRPAGGADGAGGVGRVLSDSAVMRVATGGAGTPQHPLASPQNSGTGTSMGRSRSQSQSIGLDLEGPLGAGADPAASAGATADPGAGLAAEPRAVQVVPVAMSEPAAIGGAASGTNATLPAPISAAPLTAAPIAAAPPLSAVPPCGRVTEIIQDPSGAVWRVQKKSRAGLGAGNSPYSPRPASGSRSGRSRSSHKSGHSHADGHRNNYSHSRSHEYHHGHDDVHRGGHSPSRGTPRPGNGPVALETGGTADGFHAAAWAPAASPGHGSQALAATSPGRAVSLSPSLPGQQVDPHLALEAAGARLHHDHYQHPETDRDSASVQAEIITGRPGSTDGRRSCLSCLSSHGGHVAGDVDHVSDHHNPDDNEAGRGEGDDSSLSSGSWSYESSGDEEEDIVLSSVAVVAGHYHAKDKSPGHDQGEGHGHQNGQGQGEGHGQGHDNGHVGASDGHPVAATAAAAAPPANGALSGPHHADAHIAVAAQPAIAEAPRPGAAATESREHDGSLKRTNGVMAGPEGMSHIVPTDSEGQGAVPAQASATSQAADLQDDHLLVFDCDPAVFTSLLPRTIETAAPLAEYFHVEATAALNPMSTGIAMGVPLQHLASQFPDEWQRFMHAPDRVHHRVTGGESLADVVARLTPFVIELERQRVPVLAITHLTTLQVLLCYFRGTPLAEAVDINVPMNVLIEMVPHQYGWIERRYTFRGVAADETITDSFHVRKYSNVV